MSQSHKSYYILKDTSINVKEERENPFLYFKQMRNYKFINLFAVYLIFYF